MYNEEAKRFQEEATRALHHGIEMRIRAIEESIKLLKKTYNNMPGLSIKSKDEGLEFIDIQRRTTDVLRGGATAILRHADVFDKSESVFKLWADAGKRLDALKHREDKIFRPTPKASAKLGSTHFSRDEFLVGVEETQHNLIMVLHDNALLRENTGGLKAVWDTASYMKVIKPAFNDMDRRNLGRIHDDLDSDNGRIGDLLRQYSGFYL